MNDAQAELNQELTMEDFNAEFERAREEKDTIGLTNLFNRMKALGYDDLAREFKNTLTDEELKLV